MKKTENFFVISNYNTDPSYLLDYCKDYIVYDQSDKNTFDVSKTSLKFQITQHTGHNITDYFKFFIDNYDNLPETIALIKGNIIGRHLSKAYFEKTYLNQYYTFLYNDEDIKATGKKDVYFLASESEFLEINNSWYVAHHPHKYFGSFNQLLNFIYQKPVVPEYCLFAPGACYIISKHQVLKHTKEFYINLNKILGYTLDPKFPSEAHQIERMLHTIYTCNYEVHAYMNNEQLFDLELDKKVSEKGEVLPKNIILRKIKKLVQKK
ncbi:DUF3431 domain-containing protein [Mucilaginibacter antarcticus]|uniref:DUF3431 domain-containing protein n=1 Tax=Mucilaginibacter antarcticus TaxID=1855725 RepID=A0ABW5XMF7_9SPHI